MNLGSKQSIEDIHNSSVNQINGNITINNGISAADAIAICKEVIENQMAILRREAQTEADARLKKISDKIVSSITEDLLQRFKEPAIQFALNETISGYIKTGDDELGENLVDLLIERLEAKERTTQQSVIDEARQIISKLSSNAIALLSILVFQKIIFPLDRSQYDNLIRKLSPIAAKLGKITDLDIAYLKQVGCGMGITNFQVSSPLEETLLKSYDLLFKHKISNDDFNKILNSDRSVNWKSNLGVILGLFSPVEKDDMLFKVTCSRNVLPFFQNVKPELLPTFDRYKEAALSYSPQEVIDYHLDIDPNWEHVFELFKKPNILSFQLNPVGIYIGIRQLTRIGQIEDIPMTLFY